MGEVMNNKLEEFKQFVKKNPYLITYVKNKEMTWQSFYEIYSLYGEDNDVWNKYVLSSSPSTKETNTKGLNDLINIAKNIDVDKVQNGITSLQKAISLFGDLLIQKDTSTKNTYTPRPLYKSFED